MGRAWSIITLGDDRQYGGNTGYADMPGRQYRYDSNVANHRQLASGDLVVVRDREVAQGLARIVAISEEPGTKIIQRCPECNTTSIKRRPTMTPPWRCGKGHVFATPMAEEETVVQYTADFGDTFQQLPDGITAQQLKGLALRPNDQISIEELDLAGLEVLLQLHSSRAAEAVSVCAMSSALEPEDAAEDRAYTVFEPSTVDQRTRVLREIATRRGQRSFRTKLIRRYSSTCVITGCDVVDLLEAAHIWPYRSELDNHLENGLLLRADIHTLFDLNLIVVHPDTLAIHLDSRVRRHGYEALEGQCLRVGNLLPSREALRKRWAAWRQL